MGDASIKPYYEARLPSAQNVADIFSGHWKSALPRGIVSGEAPMFEDARPEWAGTHLPGGFHGKSVLELGPFEAYQTYLLLHEGARRIVSVEANAINFLKCLCVKELYHLDAAHFLFGDVSKFVNACVERYDVVWASGVLYHLQDPIGFIETVSRIAPAVYVWTHYFDDSIAALRNGQERHFVAEADEVCVRGGREIVLHARSYLIPDYERDLPMNWEGGLEQISYWLTKDDIFALFQRAGMRIAAVDSAHAEVNGLPAVGFIAIRD